MAKFSNSTRVQAPAYLDPESTRISNEMNDQSSLNSTERDGCDGGDEGSKSYKPLLKCKTPAIFSTFNCRSLSQISRLQELHRCTRLFKTDILSIQEHRFHHPNLDLNYTNLTGGFQLITASAVKNSQGSTIGGIGMVLSPKAVDNLLTIEKISDRIMVAEFNTNPKTTFIACYGPTNCSEENLADEFFCNLRELVGNVPQHNFLIIAGDFNSQLGPEDVPFSYNRETNRNGEKLVDLCQELSLFAANTTFMKKREKLWSFQHPSGSRSQIDYILVRTKWRNSVHNAQSYSTFFSVGSDHRVVSMKTVLSLRSSKKSQAHPMKQIDWRLVCSNEDISHQYAVDVKNRFDTLIQESDDMEVYYQQLVQVTQDVAISSLPKKKKQNNPAIDSNTMVSDARSKVEKASKRCETQPTRSALKALTAAQKELDDVYLSAEAAYISGEISRLSSLEHARRHAESWKVINKITGRKQLPTPKLRSNLA